VALDEFELIRRYFGTSELGFPVDGVVKGIGDDAAILAIGVDEQLLISMDLLQEGVHFPAACDPLLLGRRALLVNISDLAAMGASPLCFTLGLSLPHADPDWLQAFSEGLADVAMAHACPLVGGDTSRGPLAISIQVHGTIPSGEALMRSGATVGDDIYVTGTLGDAAAALKFILAGESVPDVLLNAYYEPESRIRAGIALRGLASAAIDVSDGLLADLGHILDASGVGARVHLDRLPLSPAFCDAVAVHQQVELAVSGGDDYELCFTAPPDCADRIHDALGRLDVGFCRIGEIVSGNSILWLDAQQQQVRLTARAYSHFRND